MAIAQHGLYSNNPGFVDKLAGTPFETVQLPATTQVKLAAPQLGASRPYGILKVPGGLTGITQSPTPMPALPSLGSYLGA